MLGTDHVLTCAHVIVSACDHVPGTGSGAPATEVIVDSPIGSWKSEVRARVEDGAWVAPLEDERGDMALLRLGRSLPEGSSAPFRGASLSWDRAVRAFGFPKGAEDTGVWADAALAGRVGPEGEWFQMNPVPGRPWVRRGFSGSAVVDAEHGLGDVVGMVVSEFRDESAPLSFMIPIETIIKHIPRVRAWVGGSPRPGAGDPAVVRRVREFFADRTWGGVMVAVTGDDHSPVSIALRDSLAASDLGAGDRPVAGESGLLADGVDLVLDASGRTADEVAGRVAERIGIRSDQSMDPARAVVRAVPAMGLMVDRVDDAANPADLVSRLLGPLSARAVTRGIRLLVGFRQSDASAQLRLGLLRGQINRIRAIEDANRQAYARIVIAEPRPPSYAAVLRLRLTQLRAERQHVPAGVEELERDVDSAMRTVVKAWRRLREGLARRDELRGRLDGYKVVAARGGLAEDPAVSTRYREAYEALWDAPCDPGRATEAVDLYVQAIRRAGGSGEERP